jgi:hypothetical protein
VSFDSLTGEKEQPADILLVDEGQLLMTFDALSRLSSVVVGGLDTGRWCLFMDENNQAGVAGAFDREAFEYLQSGLSSGRLPLRRNCRNTKEIIRQVDGQTYLVRHHERTHSWELTMFRRDSVGSNVRRNHR